MLYIIHYTYIQTSIRILNNKITEEYGVLMDAWLTFNPTVQWWNQNIQIGCSTNCLKSYTNNL